MITATMSQIAQQAAPRHPLLAGRHVPPVGSMPVAQDRQDSVSVKPSPIHGLGLFARRTFSTGESILEGESDPARHVNHCCDANAFLRFEDGTVSIVALRPIRANEEITLNYAINRWDGAPWACNCGAARCLHEVPPSFFDLPLERQIELSPLLAPWFIAEHRGEYESFLRETGIEDAEEA